MVARFRTQKSAALLAYLAYHPHRTHPRDVLAELFWPKAPPEQARSSLRTALASLRRQLEPPGIPSGSVLFADRTAIRLNPSAFIADTQEFHAALTSAVETDIPSARLSHLSRAIEIYGGELLPGFYDDWILPERARLAEAYRGALCRLAELVHDAGDSTRALEYARRAVTADPLDESAHELLCRLLIATGRPEAARRHHDELTRTLKEQLGEAPSAAIEDLLDSLPARRFVGSLPISETATPSGGSTPQPVRSALKNRPDVSERSRRAGLRSRICELPLQLTHFFGRDPEIAALLNLLRDGLERSEEARPRLITLTGPGGIGKTRLAIEAAREWLSAFGGEACFVPLADLEDARSMPRTIAAALGIDLAPGIDPLDGIAHAVEERPMLLVLDNAEHLLPTEELRGGLGAARDTGDAAAIVLELLSRLPRALCLVTSRQRLNLAGERECPVGPLPAPPAAPGSELRAPCEGRLETGPGARSPERLMEFPSIQLFVDRAQAARPDFQITPRNAGAVATLCERLEGVPLALELAAARALLLTPEQMLIQLRERLNFLVSRRRDAPPRHRTLRAAIAWSVEALPDELRRFFARLSVFRGGWTLDAARVVCDGEEGKNSPSRALDALSELRDRSLIFLEVETQVTDPSELRHRMLESLREFGAEALSSEERTALCRRHAGYYAALAEEAAPRLHGPDQAGWLDRLEAEHDNFRAALAWCLTDADARELGLRMAAMLSVFWYVRGHTVEGRGRLAELLAASDLEEASATRAAALSAAASLASAHRDWREAGELYQRSMARWRALGEWRRVAQSLCHSGNVAQRQGDAIAARVLYSQSLALCRELGDRALLAHLRKCLGVHAIAEGDGERARACFEESCALYQELGNSRGVAMVLGEMAHLAARLGDEERAAKLLPEYLWHARCLKDAPYTADALAMLGRLARIRGDDGAARSLFAESLAWRRKLGDPEQPAVLLLVLASLAQLQGDRDAARSSLAEGLALLPRLREARLVASCLEIVATIAMRPDREVTGPHALDCRALRLFAAGQAHRAATGAEDLWPAERARRERRIETLRAALGGEAFASTWAEGCALSPEAAIREALDVEL
jgi:predicted ATPase/DNA-binding SARP family transcriptional activator